MGDRRSKLIQNYEDAKLALLLDEYAEVYGKFSTEQYKRDLADGKIKKISDQEAAAQLNAILQRAEEEEARESRIGIRLNGIARKIATVAASIAIFFFLMVSVQAAGIDVFGAVGKWTDSIFHFESGQKNGSNVIEEESSTVDIIKQALLTQGIPAELSPSWLPRAYKIKEITLPSNSDYFGVTITLDNNTDYLLICFDKTNSGKAQNYWYEKDSGEVETVIVGEKTFFLLQNDSVWSGVWEDNNYAISILSSKGKQELIQIIQSIGGQHE